MTNKPEREYTKEEIAYISKKVDLPYSQISETLKTFWLEWRERTQETYRNPRGPVSSKNTKL